MTDETIEKSRQIRASLHPDLHAEYEAQGSANWLRQLLLRALLSKMEASRRMVVQTKLMRMENYADIQLYLEQVPDAVLLANGDIRSKAWAVANGLALAPVVEMPELPMTLTLAASWTPQAGGRPRADGVSNKPQFEFPPLPEERVKTPDELHWEEGVKPHRLYRWHDLPEITLSIDDPHWKLRDVDRVESDIEFGKRRTSNPVVKMREPAPAGYRRPVTQGDQP